MKSWKTTLGGILAGTGTLFAASYPEHAKHGLFAAALGQLLLGLAARDNGVSSEEAGVKSVTPPKIVEAKSEP